MDDAALRAWRRALRERLLAARDALPPDARTRLRERVDAHLTRAFPGLARGVFAFCWPHRGEYDARFLARSVRARGGVTVLPVVVRPRAPLVFREWRPGAALERGPLGIPFPVGTPERVPDVALVPLVGFDDAGYRLGYGGGFFDRTLAALAPRPVAIGVAWESAHVDTIHPQPHDIPMDWIVTERGVYRRDGDRLAFLGAPPEGTPSERASPVCYADGVDPGYFGDDPPTRR